MYKRGQQQEPQLVKTPHGSSEVGLVSQGSIRNIAVASGFMPLWRGGNEAIGLPSQTMVLAGYLELDLH